MRDKMSNLDKRQVRMIQRAKVQLFGRFYKEISETQKRRNRLEVIKITFVTTLLGFGAVQINGSIPFYQILYLAPLVAAFLDCLIMGEHFAGLRMGTFLRLHSSSIAVEKEYEFFVSNNRDYLFIVGSRGFTFISFIAAIVLVYEQGSLSCIGLSWFIITLLLFIITICYDQTSRTRLNSQKKLHGKPDET